MAPDCIFERELQLQAQLFTFLKGVHEDLEPYWYKTVEGGDIDVSSLSRLLGMTDVAWRNFAACCSWHCSSQRWRIAVQGKSVCAATTRLQNSYCYYIHEAKRMETMLSARGPDR